jgi:hypothetical protein
MGDVAVLGEIWEIISSRASLRRGPGFPADSAVAVPSRNGTSKVAE